MECQQMKSNQMEATTNPNDCLAVPFAMTVKTILLPNQDCFDSERNALFISFALQVKPRFETN